MFYFTVLQIPVWNLQLFLHCWLYIGDSSTLYHRWGPLWCVSSIYACYTFPVELMCGQASRRQKVSNGTKSLTVQTSVSHRRKLGLKQIQVLVQNLRLKPQMLTLYVALDLSLTLYAVKYILKWCSANQSFRCWLSFLTIPFLCNEINNHTL